MTERNDSARQTTIERASDRELVVTRIFDPLSPAVEFVRYRVPQSPGAAHAVQMLVGRVLRQFGLDEAFPLMNLDKNDGGHGRSFPAPGWRPVKGAKSVRKNRKQCWRAHTPQMK